MTQTKQRHSMRRLHTRMAERRRNRRRQLQPAGGRGRAKWPNRLAARQSARRDTAAQSSSRRVPTRQELQIEEEFEQAARELGLR